MRKVPSSKGKPIDPVVLENLIYDPTSPSGLRFRQRTHFNQKKDLVVGTYSNTGRSRGYACLINGTGYKCHRLIWFICRGEDPVGFEIDHIDGDPWNNTIENLRKVPREINVRNAKKRHDNKTGTTGVHFTDAGRGCHYWVATWRTLQGERKTKNFSIKKLGSELALAQAVAYRQEKFLEIKTQAGYTERHGKEANEH